MSDLQVLAVGGKVAFTADFTLEVPVGVTVSNIAFTIPPPLSSFAISPDLANKKSTVGLQGAVHGVTYQVRATATLSSGEDIVENVTVRGFNG